MKQLKRLLLTVLALLLGACAAERPRDPPGEPPYAAVFVVNHGWHSGLAIRKLDIPSGVVPESADFPHSDYLELGWGDWDYYQAPDPGLWLTLRAAFWPTRSVLHVVGIQGRIPERFGGFEWRRLDLSSAAYNRLMKYIHESFARGGNARVGAIRPGLERYSFFYPARGNFHILNNCNSWIARALKTAGFSVGWPLPVTSGRLIDEIDSNPAVTGLRRDEATPR